MAELGPNKIAELFTLGLFDRFREIVSEQVALGVYGEEAERRAMALVMSEHAIRTQAAETQEDSPTPQGAGSTAAAKWVAGALGREQVLRIEAPSDEAWALYSWAKDSPAAKGSFWGQIWPKVAMSAQGGANSGTVGDGKLKEMCAEIERISLAGTA